ncbi:GNAT family N-acetyltransferase [Clostridium sp. D2Q-11]|uniref:GNAT family N-acetyltransferase n=1 Tax=Anaeromonas frigoriresistens TaxID=2683708 RepID=A0A942UW62_9FIRM|nr:GNAT family N-acetyltransferase [Anaeromonas frigoriresistens]MBS4537526.1 GNAT family N-acetyltransferase [Anaeromonas frigoriresistens]
MIKLERKEFKKVTHLIKTQDELSVFSVINGSMPGEIYVNDIEHPTVALIKTNECSLITGASNDEDFNSQVNSKVDFWDQLTPDSSEWIDKIPTIHKNSFIRKYIRRHYELEIDKFLECDLKLPEGYEIEKVDLSIIKLKDYDNSDEVLGWLESWGDDEKFQKYGSGYFIHNNKVIVSWSLSDCYFEDKIAIGVHTDERYRNNGLGRMVVSATIKDCFAKGYKKIDWLCVDSNKGSITIAEKLGFTYKNNYYSFSSYPPIENLTDLTELEWHEWAEYLEDASKTEGTLILDCLYSYIKSNDVEKTISIMKNINTQKITIDYLKIKDYINELQTYGMCSNFNKKIWCDFFNESISV